MQITTLMTMLSSHQLGSSIPRLQIRGWRLDTCLHCRVTRPADEWAPDDDGEFESVADGSAKAREEGWMLQKQGYIII